MPNRSKALTSVKEKQKKLQPGNLKVVKAVGFCLGDLRGPFTPTDTENG